MWINEDLFARTASAIEKTFDSGITEVDASSRSSLDLAERDVFEFGGARRDRIVARVMAKLATGRRK